MLATRLFHARIRIRDRRIMGFTKLFSSITESSIWGESDQILRTWVMFLARANWHGIVEGSIPGLAYLCHMEVMDFERCLEVLIAPDKYSRNQENDGRRIESIPGGWKILNYEIYREKNQEQVGSRADYYRKYRADKKQSNNLQQSPQQKKLHATQIKIKDIDLDTDIKKQKPCVHAQEPEQNAHTHESKPKEPLEKETEEQQTKFRKAFQVKTNRLKENYPRFKPELFFQNHLDGNKNAILLCLDRLLESKAIISNPEIYCEKIISIESGNYNEREFQKEASKDKVDFNEIVEKLKKIQG